MKNHEVISLEKAIECTLPLRKVFPDTPDIIFKTIAERAVAHKFSEKDLTDSVLHVIDNHRYGQLFVGEIINAFPHESTKTYIVD